MFEFNYETQGVCNYLVYEVKPGETIDTLVFGMISNNKIPGIAPMLFTQMNEERYLKFNVSSKVALSQYFSGVIDRWKILKVFQNITKVLLEAEEYMLEPGDFILNANYLFIDVSSQELTMICLPVLSEEKGMQISDFLRSILLSVQFNPQENCDYVARLMNYFNGGAAFSLKEFQKFLKGLDGAGSPEIKPAGKPEPEKAPVRFVYPEEKKEESTSVVIPEIRTAEPRTEKEQGNLCPPTGILTPACAPESGEGEGKKKGKKKEKGGRFLKLPFGSSKKKENPKTDNRPYEPPFTPPGSVDPGFEVPGGRVYPQTTDLKHYEEEQKREQTRREEPVSMGGQKDLGYGAKEGHPLDFGDTTELSVAGTAPTTVLKPEMLKGTEQKIPVLFRRRTGETFPVNKEIFRIGKERSYADCFIADNTNISRSHAEIRQRENGYVIVDTNSTNHTYINGRMIAGNQEHPLAFGDVIRLADEEFEFQR